MQSNNQVISENLSLEQERALIGLLNLILPPGEDGKMPGVVDLDFLTYLKNEKHIPWIREGLQFSEQFIDKLPNRLNPFLSRLTALVLQFYYQQDRVLKAIGLEARPPFPEGNHLKDGDFTLLAPVYERGRIYRDVSVSRKIEGGLHAFKK